MDKVRARHGCLSELNVCYVKVSFRVIWGLRTNLKKSFSMRALKSVLIHLTNPHPQNWAWVPKTLKSTAALFHLPKGCSKSVMRGKDSFFKSCRCGSSVCSIIKTGPSLVIQSGGPRASGYLRITKNTRCSAEVVLGWSLTLGISNKLQR